MTVVDIMQFKYKSIKGREFLDKTVEQSLSSALSSAKMEGFQITPEIESDCKLIISGELSIAEYIRRATENNVINR